MDAPPTYGRGQNRMGMSRCANASAQAYDIASSLFASPRIASWSEENCKLLPGARKTAMFCWLRREFRRFKNNVRLAGLSATCKKRVLLSVLSRPEQQLSCTSTQLSCSLYAQVECQARWLLSHQFLLPSYGANPQVQP
jgi:ribulose bisphosphate carboxylase small subunit